MDSSLGEQEDDPHTFKGSRYDMSRRLAAPLSHPYLSLSLYRTRELVEGT